MIINSPNLINQVRSRWILGKSVNGGRIGEYRSSEYRAYKLAINPKAGGYVDLMVTWSLAEKLLVRQVSTDTFEMLSTDSKFQKLSHKYGIEEFGLSDIEWSQFEFEIYKFVIETVINETYKNI